MVKPSLDGETSFASEIEFLESEVSKLVEVDFPDPTSLYSLYCVIIRKQTLEDIPSYPFLPLKGRTSFEIIKAEMGRERNHQFWIHVLEDFLGDCLVDPPQVTHKGLKLATLTAFGKHMFPELMKAFANLYRQNDCLKKAIKAYTA